MAARLRKAVIEIRRAAHDGAAVSELRELKMAALQDVYKILVLCLGKPPETFEWRYENKEGKAQPAEALHAASPSAGNFWMSDLNRYVSFVNYPGQPMHAHLEWAWERNMADQPNMDAVNIEMEEMVAMTLKSSWRTSPSGSAANSGAEGDARKRALAGWHRRQEGFVRH